MALRRMRDQDVPVVLLEAGESLANFPRIVSGADRVFRCGV